MNRIYVCATVVALLSAVSFPAAALMFGSASTREATGVSSKEPQAAAQALSPEGKPVRVISLSPATPSANVVVAVWRPTSSGLAGSELAAPPSAKPQRDAEMVKPVILPADHARPARKAAAAPRRSPGSASVSSKKLFLVSGLF